LHGLNNSDPKSKGLRTSVLDRTLPVSLITTRAEGSYSRCSHMHLVCSCSIVVAIRQLEGTHTRVTRLFRDIVSQCLHNSRMLHCLN